MCCQSKTLILSLLEFCCKYQLFWTNFKSPPPWKITYKQPTDIHCIFRVVSRTNWLLPLFYERQFKQCWGGGLLKFVQNSWYLQQNSNRDRMRVFGWQHICYVWLTCFSTDSGHTYGYKLCYSSRLLAPFS
jgi:hypothetical protein